VTGATHVPPADCPVCGERLNITRLGCGACGTELSGRFTPCTYCALTASDRRILQSFLVSRGNMRELARDLGVSYPTARQRFADLLVRLGLEAAEPAVPPGVGEPADGTQNEWETGGLNKEEVLRRLAAGELDLAEAEAALGEAVLRRSG
jgi:hypothetical protein